MEGLLNPVSNLGLYPEACGESQKGLGMEWLGYDGYKASSGPFSSNSGNGYGRVMYLYESVECR